MAHPKKASESERKFVFDQILSNICATQAWFVDAPAEAPQLEVSLDRAGTLQFYQLTNSQFGDLDTRNLVVRGIDFDQQVLKEDLTVYHRQTGLKQTFPKGGYQSKNYLYANTHHRPIEEALPNLRAEVHRLLNLRLAQLQRSSAESPQFSRLPVNVAPDLEPVMHFSD